MSGFRAVVNGKAHFSRRFFDFFRELSVNNDRAWFEENKARYEVEVLGPLIRFVEDFGPRLKKISKHYVAIPKRTGGSIFRIYRDTRFAKDKAPYKTHGSLQFRHTRGKDVHAPGFYLHLEPNRVFAACGMWHPDREPLAKVRNAIATSPAAYKRAIGDTGFAACYEIGGTSLKRPPKGFDPDHQLIEEIKRKDFIASTELSEKEACRADFLDRYTEACVDAKPFIRFLTRAVDLEW